MVSGTRNGTGKPSSNSVALMPLRNLFLLPAMSKVAKQTGFSSLDRVIELMRKTSLNLTPPLLPKR